MELPYFPPYRIKVIEKIQSSTPQQRKQWLEETQYNLFDLTSRQVLIDLLTDSGTGGLSAQQWAAMMTGDESYAGSQSFVDLKKTITEITGYEYVLPAHQGRAAEKVLFSGLIKKGHIVPGNRHFFTTALHIEAKGGKTIDCTLDESRNLDSNYPFKGNVDLKKLEKIYQTYGKERIPCCVLTITCNSVGGQPVSLTNIKAVSKLSKKYGIPVFYDAARFAQNAYFIKTREAAYQEHSIREIVRETFDAADGMFMSSKKDGLVNMGGFIAFRDRAFFRKTAPKTVLYEGFTTYGGMSGRTMAALSQGLQEAVTFAYLKSRIAQVHYLGEKLDAYGIPLQKPYSGHAVFLKALKIFPHIPRKEFPSHALSVALYKEAGIRAGNGNVFPPQKDPETGTEQFPATDLLRLTIPQRLYTVQHLDYIAAAVKRLYDQRAQYTRGYRLRFSPQAPVMKMFGVRLQKIT